MPLPLAVPLIAMGVKALGSIFGGISASKAMKRYKQGVQKQMDENENWYDRRYNEDATQRADAQRAIQLTEDAVRKRNKAAAGQAAIMGGNEASVAAAKEANSQATADVASRIAAAGEARKDKIESQYLARKQQLQDQLNNIEVGKAQNTAQAIQGVSSAAGDAIMNLGSGSQGGDIWSRGGYKNLTQMQRQINDAVAAQRVKDLMPEMKAQGDACSNAFFEETMSHLRGLRNQ